MLFNNTVLHALKTGAVAIISLDKQLQLSLFLLDKVDLMCPHEFVSWRGVPSSGYRRSEQDPEISNQFTLWT